MTATEAQYGRTIETMGRDGAMAAAQAEWARVKSQAETVLRDYYINKYPGAIIFRRHGSTCPHARVEQIAAHDGSFDLAAFVQPAEQQYGPQVFKAAALLWTERRVAAAIAEMAGEGE